MDKVKLGFIGTGGMAGAHMRNLKDNFEDVEFSAMCDISEDRAKSRAEEFGGNAYTDYRVMYDKEDLDAVYICTPPFAHGEQERIACEQDIAMFIEKPIHSELEPAIIINEYVEQSGVITSVGYHWRYGATRRTRRRCLESNRKFSARSATGSVVCPVHRGGGFAHNPADNTLNRQHISLILHGSSSAATVKPYTVSPQAVAWRMLRTMT